MLTRQRHNRGACRCAGLGILTLFLLITVLLSDATAAEDKILEAGNWSASEWRILRSLALTKLPTDVPDPSNAVAGSPAAIALGQQLFFDSRYSRNGEIACSSCHQPQHSFSDGKRVPQGMGMGRRNVPSLLNVAHQSWFFWDGRKDSLWSQALAPIEDPNEHGLSRTGIVQLFLNDSTYRQAYEAIFGPVTLVDGFGSLPADARPDGELESISQWRQMSLEQRQFVDRTFANLGKSIAAYVGTLRSSQTRFDHYLTEYEKTGSSTLLSADELAGARVFIGPEAGCINCHNGPLLSNGDFQNIGTGVKGVDSGRSEVVERLRWDRFNCLGEFSDAKADECRELQYLNPNRHAHFGSFKVPSLRNVSTTGPFMHDGRYPTLAEAISHYNDASQLSDTHLPPISLSPLQQQQLAYFLATLSDL